MTAIRRAQPGDLDDITRVHLESFRGFFLTVLGARFVRLMYEEIMKSEAGVLVVAEDGRQVIGLAAGTTEQAGFYKSLIRSRLFAFGFAALPAAIRRPAIIPRLMRALRRPAESATSSAPACLMSLVVSSDAAGKGVGGQLVTAFCEELRERGANLVCLTTDAVENDSVNRFYRRLGWRVAQQLTTPEGRVLNEYVREL